MKAVPWQSVKKDIQNILKQYPCTVTKQELNSSHMMEVLSFIVFRPGLT